MKKTGTQQGAKHVKENCRKPGSDTKENLHKTNSVKVRNWDRKVKQAVHQCIAKNKATTELHTKS